MCRLSEDQLRYLGLLDWQEDRHEDNANPKYDGIEGVHSMVCQWSVFDDIAAGQNSPWFRRYYTAGWVPDEMDRGFVGDEVTAFVTEELHRAVREAWHNEWYGTPAKYTQGDLFDNPRLSWRQRL